MQRMGTDTIKTKKSLDEAVLAEVGADALTQFKKLRQVGAVGSELLVAADATWAADLPWDHEAVHLNPTGSPARKSTHAVQMLTAVEAAADGFVLTRRLDHAAEIMDGYLTAIAAAEKQPSNAELAAEPGKQTKSKKPASAILSKPPTVQRDLNE